jgi:hypothetical protein
MRPRSVQALDWSADRRSRSMQRPENPYRCLSGWPAFCRAVPRDDAGGGLGLAPPAGRAGPNRERRVPGRPLRHDPDRGAGARRVRGLRSDRPQRLARRSGAAWRSHRLLCQHKVERAPPGEPALAERSWLHPVSHRGRAAHRGPPPAFAERSAFGDSAAALAVAGRRERETRGELGLQLQAECSIGGVPVTGHGKSSPGAARTAVWARSG